MKNYSVILNLTQHQASEEQVKAGVVDLPSPYREKLVKLLTFNEIPSCNEIEKRAGAIYDLVIDFCLDENSPVRDEVREMIISNDGEFGNKYEINEKAFKKLNLAFMIGGALWLMKPLIEELEGIGQPLFAFTKRVVEEIPQPDGNIKKVAIFKHEGFVPAC